jgi:hypothetical protein
LAYQNDSHAHAFDDSGVPTWKGDGQNYATDEASTHDPFDGKPFDEHDFGPGWTPVGEE